MKFLFECEDDILLPRTYGLVDDFQEFLKIIKEEDVAIEGKTSADKFKVMLKNIMVNHPKETGEILAKLWVLEDGEKAPNALKTMAVFFQSEDAIDFFTSVIPSIMELSNVLSKK